MNRKMSRREFLKLAGVSAASLAFRPLLTPASLQDTGDMIRVAIHSVSVYSQPSDKSTILFQRYRDDLVHVYGEVVSEDGPVYNPLWYRVWGGYIHSGHVVRVKSILNPIINVTHDHPRIAEVTVPYTQAMLKRYRGWEAVYRLYYDSVHWVTGVEDGPDGKTWYKVRDELLDLEYHVAAPHLRLVPPEELTPLSTDVPVGKKRIEVSLARQTVTAFENEVQVRQMPVSTGVGTRNLDPTLTPTETPHGTFHIQSKMPSKHMGGGVLTDDLDAYILPGVPWVCFFQTTDGYAFHGTWWHTNFGIQMSHGCINMKNVDAKWLFRWTTPYTADPTPENTIGYGTLVEIT